MQRALAKPFGSVAPGTCRAVRVSNLRTRLPVPRLPRATSDKEETGLSKASVDDEVLPTDEIRRLAALRRQQQQEISKDSNPVQGALEEAQLITWPKPQKAALDTVLVLFIVSASGAMLFGMNVVLAELSEWWYHLA
ncbi:hypothetical protein HYH03_005041 [Edaphochlamys debaryana]|uniref:Uncharacterized protein n=1 Tax=Edaphochlamys debaryana TaxID=47281 RepID=A0A835Y8F9_9CHLO|nr:hypothetical protein HYH03_005041 [Edaphochlamys debaryana]|eukprot:KAG2497039.1 hypothetical protein HYH03_005041 [Edaphochlamys debaryana]